MATNNIIVDFLSHGGPVVFVEIPQQTTNNPPSLILLNEDPEENQESNEDTKDE